MSKRSDLLDKNVPLEQGLQVPLETPAQRCLGIEGIEAQHGIARHGILRAQLS